MSFTSPPELLTAITDIAIIPFAVTFIVVIGQIKDKGYMRLWRLLLICMSVSGFGGFVAHGIVHGESADNIIWILLQTVMLATVMLFLCIAVSDLRGKVIGGAFAVAVAVLFTVTAVLTPVLMLNGYDYFVMFLTVAAICVGSGLFIYPVLIFKGKRYAIYMLIGIIIQAVGILPRMLNLQSVIAIGAFDGNSIYHTMAAISLCVFGVGVIKRDREIS